jgi:hypothetical protein
MMNAEDEDGGALRAIVYAYGKIATKDTPVQGTKVH